MVDRLGRAYWLELPRGPPTSRGGGGGGWVGSGTRLRTSLLSLDGPRVFCRHWDPVSEVKRPGVPKEDKFFLPRKGTVTKKFTETKSSSKNIVCFKVCLEVISFVGFSLDQRDRLRLLPHTSGRVGRGAMGGSPGTPYPKSLRPLRVLQKSKFYGTL